MSSKFQDSEATRIISALDTRNERKSKDGAQVSTTWGTVGSVDAENKFASAYLYGETAGAYMSEGFRIPEAMYLTVGDKVKVAINYATGERWVEEALYSPTAYKKITVDIANGIIRWASGAAATDVRFLRSGTEALEISDAAGGDMSGGLTVRSFVRADRASAGNGAFSARVNGDGDNRMLILAGGQIEWGDGTAARDVNLYRSAADLLATDDVLGINFSGGVGPTLRRGSLSRSLQYDTNGDATASRFIVEATVGQEMSINIQEAGDTVARVALLGTTQKLEFGPGGATARDVNLYRSAANELKTDDKIIATLGFEAGAGANFRSERTAAASTAFVATQVGDVANNERFVVAASGAISWGDGTAARDVTLYRSGASILASDDEVRVYRTSAANNAHTAYLDGEANRRWGVAADGSMWWGAGGASVVDVNLYRSAANVLSLATGDTLAVNNVQIVTSRRTGWGAPTGTATRTAFATDTVTLINLARAVKALVDDLTTHGLIGA